MMLDYVPAVERERVVIAMGQAVDAWRAYRDDVAEACGVTRDSSETGLAHIHP
jgi:hypothetical protein